jgi:hypothetical protein
MSMKLLSLPLPRRCCKHNIIRICHANDYQTTFQTYYSTKNEDEIANFEEANTRGRDVNKLMKTDRFTIAMGRVSLNSIISLSLSIFSEEVKSLNVGQ